MTGTAFSMVNFQKTADDYSPLRASTMHISPVMTFRINHMISLLSQYWRWEEDTWTDKTVRSNLTLCEGRPLIFIQVIFIPLFAALQNNPNLDVVSKETLLRVIKHNSGEISRQFYLRMQGLIDKDIQVVPNDEMHTTRSFLPYLIKSLMFEDGRIRVSRSSHFEKAISTGLLPVVARPPHELVDGEEGERGEEIFKEPPAWRGLQTAIDEELLSERSGRGLLAVCRSLLELEAQSKGTLAEKAFVYDLVLRSYVHRLKNRDERSQYQGISLHDLLAPLLPDVDFAPRSLNDYRCFITKATRSGSVPSNRCALHFFEQSQERGGDLNQNIILYDLPTAMGADIVFVVRNSSTGQQKLVAVQSKNKVNATATEAMLTLHPGTQYLTNYQRECLLQKSKVSSGFIDESSGAGKGAWSDYIRFCEDHDSKVNNWIRLALVGRRISEDLLKFVKAAETKNRAFMAKYVSKTAPKKEEAKDIRDSPIAFLSLLLTGFLDADSRRLFVDEGDGSVMSLPKKKTCWVAVSVKEMKDYCRLQGVSVAVS